MLRKDYASLTTLSQCPDHHGCSGKIRQRHKNSKMKLMLILSSQLNIGRRDLNTQEIKEIFN